MALAVLVMAATIGALVSAASLMVFGASVPLAIGLYVLFPALAMTAMLLAPVLRHSPPEPRATPL